MQTFANKIWDVPNILILIEITDKCVIGGYSKVGWKSDKISSLKHENDRAWGADKDAFLFSGDRMTPDTHNIHICNIKQDQDSISHALGYLKLNIVDWDHHLYFIMEIVSVNFNIKGIPIILKHIHMIKVG